MEKAVGRIKDAVASAGTAKKKSPEAMQNAGDQDEFSEIHERMVWLMEEEREISDRRQKNIVLCDQLSVWGDFSPSDLEELSQKGVSLRFYQMGRKEIGKLDKGISFIRLASTGKSQMIALVDSILPEGIVAQQLALPAMSLSEMHASIKKDTERLAEIDAEMVRSAIYLPLYSQELARNAQDTRFETVADSMRTNDKIAWITGFIPADAVSAFKELATKKSWGVSHR